MAKTCRTCAARAFYCDVTGGDLISIHRFRKDCDCPFWSKCETPLLVDVLAEALNAMLTLPYRPLRSSSRQAARIDMIEANAKAALSRYQEEVGDA
jgi:hypothetical protein